MGFDNPKSLGNRAFGAVFAVPVFVNFMTNGYHLPSLDFPVPNGIKFESIDLNSGQPATGEGTIMEAFKVDGYKPNLDHQNSGEGGQTASPIINEETEKSEEIY